MTSSINTVVHGNSLEEGIEHADGETTAVEQSCEHDGGRVCRVRKHVLNLAAGVASVIGALMNSNSANAIDPIEGVMEQRVDLIEVNHFYDEWGKLVFDQVIFYDWCHEQNRYNVRAWRLLKKPTQVPKRDWNTGDYIAVWHDGELLREVRSSVMKETWTQHDPELIEREYLDKEKRLELQKVFIARKPINVSKPSNKNYWDIGPERPPQNIPRPVQVPHHSHP